jgi:hypothetical protein
MSSLRNLAAEMLETSAAGYAAAAVALLQPSDAAAPPGSEGANWKAHLVQRVLELAAAVRIDQPSLFAQRIAWLRRAALARGSGDEHLRAARSARNPRAGAAGAATTKGAPSLELALKPSIRSWPGSCGARCAQADRLALAYALPASVRRSER